MSDAVAAVSPAPIPAKAFVVRLATTEEETRYQLGAVALLPDGRVAATDGHLLAVLGAEQPGVNLGFDTPRLIPAKAARFLSRATGPVTVEPDGTLTATLPGGADIRVQPTAGSFPNVDRIVTKPFEPVLSALLNPALVERAMQMLGEMKCQIARFEFPTAPDWPVKIVGEDFQGRSVQLWLMPMHYAKRPSAETDEFPAKPNL